MRNVIEALVGKECWGIIAGAGTGSRVELRIGKKVEKDKPSRNTFLNDEERRYDGEYNVFIQDCSWRLVSAQKGVICTSKSENSAGGEMISGLEQLRGQAVTAVRLDDLTLDLNISFENGLSLSLFCDCTDADEDGDNYSVFYRDTAYTAGAKSQLLVEGSAAI